MGFTVGFTVGFAVGFAVGIGVGCTVEVGCSVGIGVGCTVEIGCSVEVGCSVGIGVGCTVGLGVDVAPHGIEKRTAYSFRPSAASYAPTPRCCQVPRIFARWPAEPMNAVSMRVVASSPYVLSPMFSPATLKQYPSACM